MKRTLIEHKACYFVAIAQVQTQLDRNLDHSIENSKGKTKERDGGELGN